MTTRQSRPMRADARRNYDRLVETATVVFTEQGAGASLDDIARRAGLGSGTLYRHFPTRAALQEAVYREGVETICSRGRALLDAPDPAAALHSWLVDFLGYVTIKRGLAKALMEEPDDGRVARVMSACHEAVRSTTAALITRAQAAGALRPDVDPTDLMRLVGGIAMATEHAPESTERVLALAFDGLRRRDAP